MFLQNNDLVALVSPAGVLPDNQVAEKAQSLLQKWGLQSYIAPHALKQNGHFAGTDAQRLKDLQEAVDNPDVKMIWALRGGYGSIRIVDDLDLSALQKQSKLLTGFSDITILHQKWQQAGHESLHAFMPVQLKDKISREVVKQTKNAIFGRDIRYSLKKHPVTTNFNQVKAPVTGGNLANLYSLLGTDLDFDTSGKILFIEDVGEQLYQIDRMMIALKKAGKLDKLKALLVGQFTDIPKNEPAFGKTFEDIILEHAGTNYPVIFEVPIGHITDNYPLMLGRDLELTNVGDQIVLSQKEK